MTDLGLFMDEQEGTKVTVTEYAGLPEAPASANVRIAQSGFEVLYTLRGWDEHDVKERMAALIASLAGGQEIAVGYIPQTADGPQTFECPMFELARRTDGKMELRLFPLLGNGQVGQYPEVRYTAEREAMWEMLKPVLGDTELGELPVKKVCNWKVTYKLGRETPKGGRYKDLLGIELA